MARQELIEEHGVLFDANGYLVDGRVVEQKGQWR